MFVALSLTLFFNLDSTLDTAAAIRPAFPAQPILVGGQGFTQGGRERAERMGGVHCLASLVELEGWIKAFASHGG